MEKICQEEDFLAIENEQIRKGFFDNYIKSISEACGHQHGSLNTGNAKRKKKDKKKKKRRTDVRKKFLSILKNGTFRTRILKTK